MRKLDSDGLLMCEIQGRIFEKSVNKLDCSSPIFIKNYMQSEIARSMDIEAFLNTNISEDKVLYGMRDLTYGTSKYNSEDMYAIGHMYRYISYVYGIDSKKLYKLLPSSILKKYSNTWSFEGPEKVIYEIKKYHHIVLDKNDDLLTSTKLNISNALKSYVFKPNMY